MKKNALFPLILFLLISCDPPIGVEVSYSIHVKNETDSDLMISLSNRYPDTSVSTSYNGWYGLKKHSETSFDSKQKWEKYIDDTPNDTISIFFISLDTFQKYGEEDVIKNHRILKRKNFGVDYLNGYDNTIVYP